MHIPNIHTQTCVTMHVFTVHTHQYTFTFLFLVEDTQLLKEDPAIYYIEHSYEGTILLINNSQYKGNCVF